MHTKWSVPQVAGRLNPENIFLCSPIFLVVVFRNNLETNAKQNDDLRDHYQFKLKGVEKATI